jgi:polyisoprenoid-binding protein YceI
MKKFQFFYLVASLSFLVAACTSAPESDEAKTSDAKAVSDSATGETLLVDTTASKIEWVATKVSGYHTGTIHIKNGELRVAGDDIIGGNFTMDMNTIVVSGPKGSDPKQNAKLLGHLKSPDFFEVNKNPEATFAITSVQPFSGAVRDTTDPRQEEISEYKVQNPTHTVSGNLTIKGIAKNIEFPARLTVNGNTAEAIAKFNIDRTQWNIVYPGKPDDLIRNEIHFGIALKARQ